MTIIRADSYKWCVKLPFPPAVSVIRLSSAECKNVGNIIFFSNAIKSFMVKKFAQKFLFFVIWNVPV